jgi:uncharacterized peroxidase-related enzyme
VKNEELVEQLQKDWRKADLTKKQFIMLQYAEKLTVIPAKMQKSDIDELIKAGFTEKDILDINQISCYFAYVNRLADGLGVPLENFWE